jgi:signal transduction histidine kinase
MRHRASMIGGTLQIEKGVHGDTVVRCQFPLEARESERGRVMP